MSTQLTPVEYYMATGWAAKREDLACDRGPAWPSGAKVRQFEAMAAQHPPGTPMVVGCSAFSAMQVYVAAAAEQAGCRAIVYVPGRKERSLATRWAAAHGAEVNEVTPGYPTVYRSRARERAEKEGGAIRWLPQLAVEDSAAQVANLPAGVERVVIPTGSGLTAVGVAVGLARLGRLVPLLLVCVSALADVDVIREQIAASGGPPLYPLTAVRHALPYLASCDEQLPDGTPLDPYYAAKARHFLRAGDCLWVSGRRALTV